MFGVKELLEQVGRLKGKEMVTNNVLTLSDLEKFSADSGSILLYNDKAIALLCKDNGVNRLYFHISSVQDINFLGDLLQQITYKPLVVDCVGKVPYLDNLEKTLGQIGFMPYVHMSRWRTNKIDYLSESILQSMEKSDDFYKAVQDNTDKILTILTDTFDPYYSWLPTKEFLIELIDEGLVFCAEKRGEIIAVTCFQKVGRNGIYSYLLAVVPELRSSGIGYMLWQYALSHFRDCHNFTSWADDTNIPSIHLHEVAGFTLDGLKDYVLVWQ